MTKAWQIVTPLSAVLTLGLLAGGLFTPGLSSEASAACTAIGSSTFCGSRGSHNTVGRTMIFNNSPASGQRLGGAGGLVSPRAGGLSTTVIGGRTSPLVQPRAFRGSAAPRRFRFARTRTMDSRIAQLRARILANEAQAELDSMNLTPAQEAARHDMPLALVRALTLKANAEAAEGLEEAPGN